MAGFSAQPDEGYSEDPLNALSASASSPFKNREDAVSALASVRSGEFPAWLTQHISNLSMSRKTGMSSNRLLNRAAAFCAHGTARITASASMPVTKC
jgi:hypothetical protein